MVFKKTNIRFSGFDMLYNQLVSPTLNITQTQFISWELKNNNLLFNAKQY